jgi:hypothetical protein
MLLILFAVVVCPTLVGIHPVHVSVCNLEYSTRTRDMEIVLKVFRDDFEEIIHARFHQPFRLDSLTDSSRTYMQVYLDAALQVHVNKKIRIGLELVSKELSEEAVWMTFRGKAPRGVQSITVNNRVLMDLFSDQTNLLIMSIDSKQKGYKLNRKQFEILHQIK